MEMISAVVGGKKVVRGLGIANDGVEIDDRIEISGGTDPCVDRLPVCLAQRAGVVVLRTDIRRDGCTHDTNSMGMGAGDDLLICSQHTGNECIVLCRSHFAVSRQTAQIVDAFKDDEPAHAGRSEHIAIEARECVRTQAIGEEMISADSLV